MAVRWLMCLVLVIEVMGVNCVRDDVPVQAVSKNNVRNHEDEVIVADQFWSADSVHVIGADLFIQDATVRVTSGSTIRMKAGASITIMEGGGFIADGTNNPIRFVRDNDAAGWSNIFVHSNANTDSCVFINCQFEGGGADSSWPAMFYCSDASPIIRNCTFLNSMTSGVYFAGVCSSVVFVDNTIQGCARYPIVTALKNIDRIGAGTYTDNGINEIRIIEGSLTRDCTIPNIGLALHMTDDVRIASADVHMSPGLMFKFDHTSGLLVTDGARLTARTKQDSPIVFTDSGIGREKWQGIEFRSGSTGLLEHVIIERVGQADGRPAANVFIDQATPSFLSCTIRNGDGYGFYLNGFYQPDVFLNNNVYNNALAPVLTNGMNVSLLRNNNLAGNGRDRVEIAGGTIDRYTEWPKLSVPVYGILEPIRIVGASLVLGEGILVEMGKACRIDIMQGGSLIANGAKSHITITGEVKSPGYWDCINFSSTAAAGSCLLNYCVITYGGGNTAFPGMVYCDGVSPTISNCDFQYSLQYGVYRANGAAPSLSDNLFSHNLQGNVYP